jgi:hypothetical protein
MSESEESPVSDATERKPNHESEIRDRNRTAFDTDMIRAATHQHNRKVTFHLSNSVVEGTPVTVDKYFIKIIDDEDNEIWVNKNHIVTALVEILEEE